MKTLISTVLCAIASFSLAAQEPAGKPPSGKPVDAKSTKTESYAVIAIGEDLQVVTETALAEMQKKADADHKKAMEEFDKAKKAAEAEKKAFDQKAPKPIMITVERGSIPTKEAADAELAKVKAAKEKAKKEKEKEKGKGEEKPDGGKTDVKGK